MELNGRSGTQKSPLTLVDNRTPVWTGAEGGCCVTLIETTSAPINHQELAGLHAALRRTTLISCRVLGRETGRLKSLWGRVGAKKMQDDHRQLAESAPSVAQGE